MGLIVIRELLIKLMNWPMAMTNWWIREKKMMIKMNVGTWKAKVSFIERAMGKVECRKLGKLGGRSAIWVEIFVHPRGLWRGRKEVKRDEHWRWVKGGNWLGGLLWRSFVTAGKNECASLALTHLRPMHSFVFNLLPSSSLISIFLLIIIIFSFNFWQSSPSFHAMPNNFSFSIIAQKSAQFSSTTKKSRERAKNAGGKLKGINNKQMMNGIWEWSGDKIIRIFLLSKLKEWRN
jgi:hypothetical protein